MELCGDDVGNGGGLVTFFQFCASLILAPMAILYIWSIIEERGRK